MARPSEMTHTEDVSAAQDVRDQSDNATESGAPLNGPVRILCFVIAAVASAALAVIAIDRLGDTFQLPAELTAQVGISPELQARFDSGELSGGEVMGLGMAEQDPDLQSKVNAANRSNYIWNTALSWAIVGLLAAGFFGFAAGFVQRSPGQMLLGLSAGAVLGAGLGAAAGRVAVWTEDLLARSAGLDQMVRTMGMHAAGWTVVDIAVGLAVGLANRTAGTLQYVAAAVTGGVISACVFSLTAAVVFSADNADLPVPDGTGNRMLWTGLCTLLMAVMLGRDASAKTGNHNAGIS